VKKVAGLWIDHRQAVIVIITDQVEAISRILAKDEEDMGQAGGARSAAPEGHQQATAENQRDRQYENHLSRYYAEVIASIRDADSVQIFGPGEAKGELKKKLESTAFSGHIVDLETVDKLTDGQIAAKVRQHFLTEHQPR
jgi:hypothetical protein